MERHAIVWKTKKIKNRGRLISGPDSKIDGASFLVELYTQDKKFTPVNLYSRPYNKDPEGDIKALSDYTIGALVAISTIITGEL